MGRVRSTLWTLALIALATPLAAQTQFQFLSAGSVTAYGYYVGPYTGLMGTGTEAQPVVLNCVDFFHYIRVGQTWTANLTSLGDGSSLANTRFGGVVDALALYRQAAWLTTQYAYNPGAYGDIQATIWRIFGGPGTPAPSSNHWLTQAQQNYQSISYDDFYVVTDVNKALPWSAQEFITTVHATPEPTTMVLLGSGLAGLGAMARRRKRRQLESDVTNTAD